MPDKHGERDDTLVEPLGRALTRPMLARHQKSKVTNVLRSCLLGIQGPPLGVSWPQRSVLWQNHTPCPRPATQKQDLLRKRAFHAGGRKAALLPGFAQLGPTKSLYEHRAGCCLAQRGEGGGRCSISSEWKDNLQLVQGLSHVHKYL